MEDLPSTVYRCQNTHCRWRFMFDKQGNPVGNLDFSRIAPSRTDIIAKEMPLQGKMCDICGHTTVTKKSNASSETTHAQPLTPV